MKTVIIFFATFLLRSAGTEAAKCDDLSSTLTDALDQIAKIQTQLQGVTTELAQTKENLAVVSLRVVPVGSIYIEYYNQPSPVALWPELTWQDISATYAGLFFRASGEGSADWGTIQKECSPRVTQMIYTEQDVYAGDYPINVQIPQSGWSDYLTVGFYPLPAGGAPKWNNEGMKLHTDNCEVRPKNQAIRIWKRAA